MERTDRTTRYIRSLALVIAALCARPSASGAVEIAHVGTIREGLVAPTSVCVSDDGLVVLEPYARRLTAFTADGILRHTADIEGDAIGLDALAPHRYIYGDRARRRVAGIDILTGERFDFVSDPSLVMDPTDVLVTDTAVYVLDAGFKAVTILSRNGSLLGRFSLQDSAGRPIGFPSSFAYDPTAAEFLILDQLSSQIWVCSPGGEYIGSFGTFGGGATDLSRGGEIVSDGRGHAYVVDRYQGKVLIYRTDGTYLHQLDINSAARSGVLIPIGIACDAQGLVYVASAGAARIDIYDIDASGATIEELLTASPVTPLSPDTVDFRSTSLTAQVSLPSDVSLACQFDFQLFLGNDTSNAVALGFAIAPVASAGDSSNNIVAVWRPLAQFVPDTLYRWRVRARSDEKAGAWSRLVSFATAGLPGSYALYQNYPNPFNPSTQIVFSTARSGKVSLTVYNILGQTVTTLVDGELAAGEHRVMWNGVDRGGARVASGIYFYRLVADSYVASKKMVLVK